MTGGIARGEMSGGGGGNRIDEFTNETSWEIEALRFGNTPIYSGPSVNVWTNI